MVIFSSSGIAVIVTLVTPTPASSLMLWRTLYAIVLVIRVYVAIECDSLYTIAHALYLYLIC